MDSSFPAFFEWATKKGIPVVILSSGMEPIIRCLLAKYFGSPAESILVIANDVEIFPNQSWRIRFRDDTGLVLQNWLLTLYFGHDKSRTIRDTVKSFQVNRPIVIYCGDGISDISAAREADLLFAKKGKDLVAHCLTEDIPFYPFDVQFHQFESFPSRLSKSFKVSVAPFHADHL